LAFNEKGDTLHKGQCINGKQIGLDETWFTPGKRETRTHYNDSGKKHGLYETWHEDGTRKDSIVYDNGKMIEVREYFVDGKERMWEEYKKGEKLLLWNAIYHDRTGKVCGKVTNGEGEYILYDENGKYPSKTTISKGITVKEEEM
jgi:antitoxin component YwqK of YwqJK toxin-antitoxin module